MSRTQQIHATVSGLVQGVGFRAATTQRAQDLGVVGWVRNNPDRTVEVIAQGTKAQLDAFVAFLHQGPPHAQVDTVDVTWTDTFIVAYDTFKTIYHR
ncbi:MAG: acylphosphatase [Chloroflexota bacterium]